MTYEVEVIVTGTIKIRVEADTESQACDRAGDLFDDGDHDDPELHFSDYGKVVEVVRNLGDDK